jgi:hypothetical protein
MNERVDNMRQWWSSTQWWWKTFSEAQIQSKILYLKNECPINQPEEKSNHILQYCEKIYVFGRKAVWRCKLPGGRLSRRYSCQPRWGNDGTYKFTSSKIILTKSIHFVRICIMLLPKIRFNWLSLMLYCNTAAISESNCNKLSKEKITVAAQKESEWTADINALSITYVYKEQVSLLIVWHNSRHRLFKITKEKVWNCVLLGKGSNNVCCITLPIYWVLISVMLLCSFL